LFIDEQQDAPPAIFTVTARRLGKLALEFSLWQDGGKITALSHTIEVVSQPLDQHLYRENSQPVPIGAEPQIIFRSKQEKKSAEKLYSLCLAHFDLAELRGLCFDLNVDHESLSGETKPAKTEALIRYLHRHGRLNEFVELVRNKRPQVDWPSVNKSIKCLNCDQSVAMDAKFCHFCGHRIEIEDATASDTSSAKRCSHCGKANRLSAVFCRYCGTSLPELPILPASPPPPDTVHYYAISSSTNRIRRYRAVFSQTDVS
jgi:hypothetical protein